MNNMKCLVLFQTKSMLEEGYSLTLYYDDEKIGKLSAEVLSMSTCMHKVKCYVECDYESENSDLKLSKTIDC